MYVCVCVYFVSASAVKLVEMFSDSGSSMAIHHIRVLNFGLVSVSWRCEFCVWCVTTGHR